MPWKYQSVNMKIVPLIPLPLKNSWPNYQIFTFKTFKDMILLLSSVDWMWQLMGVKTNVSLANWIRSSGFTFPLLSILQARKAPSTMNFNWVRIKKQTIDRSSSTSSSLFCAISVEERSAKLLKGQNATRRSKGGRVVRPVQVNEVFIHFQYLRRRTYTRLLSLSPALIRVK